MPKLSATPRGIVGALDPAHYSPIATPGAVTALPFRSLTLPCYPTPRLYFSADFAEAGSERRKGDQGELERESRDGRGQPLLFRTVAWGTNVPNQPSQKG